MTIYTGTPGSDTFVGTTTADTFNNISTGDTVDGSAGIDAITIDLSTTTTNISYSAIQAATSDGTSPLAGMMIKNIERLKSLTTGSGNDT